MNFPLIIQAVETACFLVKNCSFFTAENGKKMLWMSSFVAGKIFLRKHQEKFNQKNEEKNSPQKPRKPRRETSGMYDLI